MAKGGSAFKFSAEDIADIRSQFRGISDEFFPRAAMHITLLQQEQDEPTPKGEREQFDKIINLINELRKELKDFTYPSARAELSEYCVRTDAPSPMRLSRMLSLFLDGLMYAERAIPEPRRGRRGSRQRIALDETIADEAARLGFDTAAAAALLFEKVSTAAGLDCADPERVARAALKRRKEFVR